MNRLPLELLDAILWYNVDDGPKNTVLDLRLVCRAFDTILKPFVCSTIGLELSRLSKVSGQPQPQMDALQTVGYHCKGVFIDLMVLRDELEVGFLKTIFEPLPSMTEFCQMLQTKYCMNEGSFTETDYCHTVENMLFNCREVEKLRLNLPFQLVGRHCNAATMILANTFKAFASRPEEDSAPLTTLVLENVPDIAVCNLWMNPTDVMNIMKVFAAVRNLVITTRRHETEATRAGLFGSCLWSMVENAEQLESMCLIGMDQGDRPPRGLKQTKFWQMPIHEWKVRSLPAPHVLLSNLTCLELKRIEILPQVLLKAAESFGSTLKELYLNEIYLKVEQALDYNVDSKTILWVGLPNQRPTTEQTWIAMELRCLLPKLETCRAAFLAYDNYLRHNVNYFPNFDLADPCGLGRSVSQRFVEVVMGIAQPNKPNGQPVKFLPADSKREDLLQTLKPRPRALQVTEYDTNAYQTEVANTTSHWHESIDNFFPTYNKNTVQELHQIAETACEGMNEMRRRNSDWPSEDANSADQDDVVAAADALGAGEA